jgi:hypothetical protein
MAMACLTLIPSPTQLSSTVTVTAVWPCHTGFLGINTSSDAYTFMKDLVELESRELCRDVGANVTADDLTDISNRVTNATSNATSTDGDDDLSAGLALLARLAANPGRDKRILPAATSNAW